MPASEALLPAMEQVCHAGAEGNDRGEYRHGQLIRARVVSPELST